MPIGTPFWPYAHNFWSNDWTNSLYEPIADPIVGDVTPHRGRQWYNGAGKDSAPLPGFYGCGQDNTYRHFINGYDSRCWPDCDLAPGAFDPNQFSNDEYDCWRLPCS